MLPSMDAEAVLAQARARGPVPPHCPQKAPPLIVYHCDGQAVTRGEGSRRDRYRCCACHHDLLEGSAGVSMTTGRPS
jgi:hypothetical protein